MLLFRPVRGGSVFHEQLEARVRRFQAGQWTLFFDESAQCAEKVRTVSVGRRRRSQAKRPPGPCRWSTRGSCQRCCQDAASRATCSGHRAGSSCVEEGTRGCAMAIRHDFRTFVPVVSIGSDSELFAHGWRMVRHHPGDQTRQGHRTQQTRW